MVWFLTIHSEMCKQILVGILVFEFTWMVVSRFSVDVEHLNHIFKNDSLWIWINQFWLLLKTNLIYMYLPCQGGCLETEVTTAMSSFLCREQGSGF